MRILLDTNVVLSGILWNGPAKRIITLWLENRLTLLVSLPILEEYRDVLGRFIKPNTELFARWDHLLANATERIEPIPLALRCRDPKDQMFLEGAVGGKARYLVSGDKDLLVLKEVRGIPIVSLSVFLGQIK